MEKMYILNYPSAFGMGSDTDNLLITESNLRRLVETELVKKRNGDRFFSERMTGCWGDEVMCDSSDDEEVYQDVLKKRLTTSTTYARVNDLCEVPGDIPITIKKEHYDDTIFRVWNPWGFVRDIICGSADFTRYFVDLQERGLNSLIQGDIYEFCSYSLKNVLMNAYFMNDVESYIENRKHTLKRIRGEIKDEGRYFRDLIEDDNELAEYDRKIIAEAEATIEKFKTPITVEDTYRMHIYPERPTEFSEFHVKQYEELIADLDFRRLVYRYPIYPEDVGTVCTHHREASKSYRYDELFKKGADIEYLPAALIEYWGEDEQTIEEKEKLFAHCALRYVFGTE